MRIALFYKSPVLLGLILVLTFFPRVGNGALCAESFHGLMDARARKYSLEAGDVFKFNDGSEAYFLGLSRGNYVFLSKADGTVFSRSTSSGLAAGGGAARPLGLKVMSDPVGDSCAVISTIACLRVLDEMEALEHAELKKIMRPGLWGRLASFESQLFEHISNSGVHSWVGGRSDVQIRARTEFFRVHGIRSKAHVSLDELREHVQNGYPAILDVMVKFTEDGILAPAAKASEVYGGHSVAAIRWFTLSNGQERVLIYDSQSERLVLWPVAGLKMGHEKNLLTEYTIVYPSWAN